jgi:hypothetical protein
MSADETTIQEKDGNQLRDVQKSDIGGSESAKLPNSGLFSSGIEVASEGAERVPEEIRESAREMTLADRIKEKHAGEGLVLVNKQTGEILAIENTTQAILHRTREVNVPSHDLLTVGCYER